MLDPVRARFPRGENDVLRRRTVERHTIEPGSHRVTNEVHRTDVSLDVEVERERSDRQEAGRQKSDVVFPLPTPDDLIEDMLEEPVRIRRRLAECSNDRFETVVDGLATALDQPVGVEKNDRASRELDRRLPVLHCKSGAKR